MGKAVFYTIIFIIVLPACIRAQEKQDTLLNLKVDSSSILSLINQVEENAPYHFYYDTAALGNRIISVEAKNESLSSLLTRIFKDTDLRFAIDADNHVFITSKTAILTTLPEGFFDASGTEGKVADLVKAVDTTRTKKIVSAARLHEIGIRTNNLEGKAILSGYIYRQRTGEPLSNALVYVDHAQRSIVSDAFGFYSIQLAKGSHTLDVQAPGMKEMVYELMVYSDGMFEINLEEQVNTLKEVIVSTRKVQNINRPQLGVERLTIANIKQVPAVFGEADILRVLLTLPGVKTVGEASTGFNVRGGAADQNLILLNDATIFNPAHFFGMFSSINPEIVKEVELYKSSIPAKYGGRLSSVLDISGREGSRKEYSGSAGIGLITSRFNIDGPLIKNKTSFILGARTTYANWLLGLLPKAYRDSRAAFNDVNLGIAHHGGKNNDLYLTAYASNDHFNLVSDTTYRYSNRNISLKWRHGFSNRLNFYLTTGIDHYDYRVSSEGKPYNAYEMKFGITQLNARADFSYYVNPKHSFDFGLTSILYRLHPGSFEPKGKESLVISDIIPAEQARESAIYFSEHYTPGDKLSIIAGIRYGYFQYLGPGEVRDYAPGQPKGEDTRTGTRQFEKGKVIKAYGDPELRLSLRYILSDHTSIKAGYNSARQYLHMLTNTTAIAPTDVWKLSDPNILPQKGDQFSLGIYRNFKSNTIETSVEVYYKRMKDYLDYKPGASLVMNHHLETDVINTRGKAYGIELLIKKPGGKLNGWASYTYSRTLLKMDDPTVAEPVNKGRFYPASFDKPHDLVIAGNFRVNHRFSVSMNINYSTGRPITLPVGRYYYGGSQRVLYSDRNAYRIPDYFRTDLSMNIEGNHKLKQKTHNSWTIGVYNLTGRKNPYSVFFVSENGLINGYRLSIFGSIIPFVNFNIRF